MKKTINHTVPTGQERAALDALQAIVSVVIPEGASHIGSADIMRCPHLDNALIRSTIYNVISEEYSWGGMILSREIIRTFRTKKAAEAYASEINHRGGFHIYAYVEKD